MCSKIHTLNEQNYIMLFTMCSKIHTLNEQNYIMLFTMCSSKARASRNHFYSFIFLSTDFHELWCSVVSICLFTEVKRQWATLVLGWVTASVHYYSL